MESDPKEIINKVKAGPIDDFIKIMPHTDLRIAEFLNLTLKDRE